jgi:hypothetical protein
MQMSVDRSWLLDPANSIAAGTAYIAQQAKLTRLDPPLVAAAYNAGRLAKNDGAKNRWKLRQFPIGTGEHVDRFVRFFNDAVFVLSKHAIAPSITMYECNPDRVLTPAGTGGRAPERPADVQVRFAKNANQADVTPFSMGVLKDTLRTAQLTEALISSTSRNPADQARVMYDNLERYGVEAQKKLYGRGGDRVIDVYAKEQAKGASPTDIKAAMEREIREIGPTSVSRHACDPNVLNVFDVAPSSIKNHRAFEIAVKGEKRVKTFLVPPVDPGYHLEIPQPKQQ